MKTLKTKNLISQYEYICNEWINKFVHKQKLEFDGWIGNEVGGIASFSCQYFFNLSDIILDLKTKQKKGFIFDWQSDGVDFNIKVGKDCHINYNSYIMGLRFER